MISFVHRHDEAMGFDAIVLAGGAARRMGGVDKPMLVVAGTPILRLVLDAVVDAERRVVVGPRRAVGTTAIWCQEQPAGGGPVAGIAAALPHTAAATVLVLAADLPGVAPAVTPLRAALDESGADLAMLVSDGRPNYLAAAWRRAALASAVRRLGTVHDASMRRLTEGIALACVTDAGQWGADCDTWHDLARARRTDGSNR